MNKEVLVVSSNTIVIVYMLIKNLKFAYILLGIALLKTATLILSVAIGSLIAPKYGSQEEASMLFIYCLVATISFVLFGFYWLKIERRLE